MCYVTGKLALEDLRKDREPFALLAEFDRLASIPLWPGFDPRRVPIAVYNGEQTFLFRHLKVVEGFMTIADRQDVQVFAGQHPSVRANTAIELEGISTATAIMDRSKECLLKERAALLIHEAFHSVSA